MNTQNEQNASFNFYILQMKVVQYARLLALQFGLNLPVFCLQCFSLVIFQKEKNNAYSTQKTKGAHVMCTF